MKKIISFLTIFLTLGCNTKFATQEQNNSPYSNTLFELLSPMSPECRKAFLVGINLETARSAEKENDFVNEAFLLCEAYFLYTAEPSYINLIIESHREDVSGITKSIYKTCAERFAEDDELWIFFVEQANKTLKPYVAQQLKSCSNSEQ